MATATAIHNGTHLLTSLMGSYLSVTIKTTAHVEKESKIFEIASEEEHHVPTERREKWECYTKVYLY